jgi:chemotaxis protein methyltransferase CheR
MTAAPGCLDFLRWCLPRLRLRWPGFRRVHHQACKRIGRRVRGLRLAGMQAYRDYLETHPEEWPVLDELCRITISRFWRDGEVFAALEERVLPELARAAAGQGRPALRAWSAGCASGEEPYSLRILWRHRMPAHARGLGLSVVATDADSRLLERAAAGVYPPSSASELPAELVQAAFARAGDELRLRPEVREGISFVRQDLRLAEPDGAFDLVLCRNLAFTYFDEGLQREVLARIERHLVSGGALVIGSGEELPAAHAFVPWGPSPLVLRRDS